MKVWRGGAAVDLLAELADEDVDRAVAVRLAAAPDSLQQLVARHDPVRARAPACRAAGTRSASGRRSGRRRTPAPRAGRCAAPRSRSARRAASLLGADAAPRRGADPRDELLHRERLDEVVVGAELERVDAVVLGAARADRRRSACRCPRRARSRSRSSRRARAASGRARRRRAARSGAAPAPARPSRPPSGSKPAAARCRAIPWAITSSSSTIRTRATSAYDRPGRSR